MSRIDENEAPEGLKAVEGDCAGCIYADGRYCTNYRGEVDCIACNRKDGQTVIFKAKETGELSITYSPIRKKRSS